MTPRLGFQAQGRGNFFYFKLEGEKLNAFVIMSSSLIVKFIAHGTGFRLFRGDMAI